MFLYRLRQRENPHHALAWSFLILLLAIVQQSCGEIIETAEIIINGNALTVDVARTADEQEKGLMHRRSLPENKGMLFPYDRDKKLSFWMKNTSIPLSIAFIGADGTIKEIYDMKPFSLSLVSSRHSVRYALEVNQGYFEAHGVSVGDRVGFPDDF